MAGRLESCPQTRSRWARERLFSRLLMRREPSGARVIESDKQQPYHTKAQVMNGMIINLVTLWRRVVPYDIMELGSSNCLVAPGNADLSSHHYGDVIMGAIASQITSFTIVYSTVYSDTDQRKHQSSASLAFVRGIHRSPVNSPRKWPFTPKMFPFDDVIMRGSFARKYTTVCRLQDIDHFVLASMC